MFKLNSQISEPPLFYAMKEPNLLPSRSKQDINGSRGTSKAQLLQRAPQLQWMRFQTKRLRAQSRTPKGRYPTKSDLPSERKDQNLSFCLEARFWPAA